MHQYPEEMRQKSEEYMLMKPKTYPYSEGRSMQGGSQPQRSSWYKPRDDMDKSRSCANCGSADQHVADCTTYKQATKGLGYAPDEEDLSQTEEHQDMCKVLLLQSRGTFQDGLSVVLEGCEESKSSQTQVSTGCGTEYEKQTS